MNVKAKINEMKIKQNQSNSKIKELVQIKTLVI